MSEPTLNTATLITTITYVTYTVVPIERIIIPDEE